MAAATMLVDLMRHGEPVGGRRYRGQTDDPLSEKGWQQMWGAVGEFRGWQHIVTSPLQRCAAFADALGDKLALPVTRDIRLQEAGFGEWEGKLPAEICADDAERLFRFKSDPVRHAPPGAEALAAFHRRVGEAWQELLAAHRGQHVLVVSHAGAIRMLMAHALGLPAGHVYRLHVGNAGLTRIQVDWSGDAMLPTLLFHAGRL